MFIAKQSKQKERLFRGMKVKLRAAGCFKDQRVAHTTQVTCFENILRIGRFINPIVYHRCVIKMFDLPRSVLSLDETMFQSVRISFKQG